ncbi:MAG: HAMP domain-containing histidine kinase [Deltaproteobacteria bacterium]|nr:HAMP domain-containing histidine kinase [Deltaproteobacteria bacterium]
MKVGNFLERIFSSALWKILVVLVTVLLLVATARLLWSLYYAQTFCLGGASVALRYQQEIYFWGVLAAAALLLIVLAGFLDLWFGYVAARQFKAVTAAIGDFAKGDLSHRLGVERVGNSDIVRLGLVFNAMADRIEETVEQLKERDSLRRELVANVAHDLGTPATSIQGYVETLLLKDPEPADRRMYLEIILSNARLVTRLVRSLFELAKLDDSNMLPRREPFSIVVLSGDVVSRMEPQARSAGVDIKLEAREDLPLVEADIDLIERALSNLLDNAISHTNAGGEIRITFSQSGSSVIVSICDSGVGIDREDLERVFKRYYSGSRERRVGSSSGNGLGLAIVKRIVEIHGGELEISSNIGQGTEVKFALKSVKQ